MEKFIRLGVSGILLFLFCLTTAAQTQSGGKQTPRTAATFDAESFNRTFSHHTIDANGVRLHYVTGGKGDALILLHGFPTTWYEWKRVMPALAERFTVIAVDTRGLGDSGRPANGYDKRTLAADVYALTEKLGLKRINLAGHDLGAQIAYAYANDYPQTLDRLILMDVPIPGLAEWEQARQNWHFPFQAVPDLPEKLVEGKEREYITWFYVNFAQNQAAITKEDIDEYVRTYSQPGAMRASFEYYRAFPEDEKQNKEYAKRKLTMPILVVEGEKGTGGRLGRQMQPVAQKVRSVLIKECGHWIASEKPEELARQMLAFLGGN